MSKLKEILWGTPEEIQADQRYSNLMRRQHLSPKQEDELAHAKGLSKRLFLRRGFTLVGGTALILGVPAAAAYIASRPDTYEGPITSFRGLERVSRNTVNEMAQALESTGHPILEKISRGIQGLNNLSERPAEFPDWIGDRTFPFAFVQDSSEFFTTNFEVSKPSGDRVRFIIPSAGVLDPQEGIDELIVGIKLGLGNVPLSKDILQPSILLAKEYLTLLHGIALNEEFFDMTKRLFPDTAILDPSGREITDRSIQRSIGRRLLLNNSLERSNINWQIFDGFSLLLLGPVLRDLAATGRIRNYQNIRSVAVASNLVTESPAWFQKDLIDFMESWRLKPGFLFPEGTGAKSVSEPYASVVVKLQNEIENAKNLR